MSAKRIRTIIITSDTAAQEMLEIGIKKQVQLALLASFATLKAALPLMTEGVVDLVFMEEDDSFYADNLAFVDHLTHAPHFMLLTNDAVEKFQKPKTPNIDFLIKPLVAAHFSAAIEKIIEEKGLINLRNLTNEPHFFIRENATYHKIEKTKILFLKAMENYTQIVTENNTYTTLLSLSSIEAYLPSKDYQRVHRSYIVNMHQITAVNKTGVYLNEHKIPLTDSSIKWLMTHFVKKHLINK